MVPKNPLKIATVVTILLFVMPSCANDTPEPPPDTDTYLLTIPNRIESDQDITIRFGWSKTRGSGGSASANIYLYDVDGNWLAVLNYLPITVNVTNTGEASFQWDGRVQPRSPRIGRVPILPGTYQIGVYIYNDWSIGKKLVAIVPNSWDSDGDNISNEVEDESGDVDKLPSEYIQLWEDIQYDASNLADESFCCK
jgi:hypothetical protein